MSDDFLQQQIEYYRARAGEYDEWFYRMGRYDRGDVLNRAWFRDVETVVTTLHKTGPVGRILELAAGTGNFTQELLKIGQHITAVDASPEVLEINRRKVKAPNVDYVQADLFNWQPEQEYDMVFMGFWLSHVPPEKLDAFLGMVNRALRPGGKLFIVDSRFDQTSTARDHVLKDEQDITLKRAINDGREFTIFKVFYLPEDLNAHLTRHGFAAEVGVTDQYFIYAQAVKNA